MSEELQAFARKTADALKDPDKKQLRFNEIVACAARFYPADPRGGGPATQVSERIATGNFAL